jgi:hypothetical protein
LAVGVFGSVAGLAFCPTPLSTLSVERSPWIAPDVLVRLGLAEGPILPRPGRTLAEVASPAVAMACSGIATAFVVAILGCAERPLVPAIMLAPGLLTEYVAGLAKRPVK